MIIYGKINSTFNRRNTMKKAACLFSLLFVALSLNTRSFAEDNNEQGRGPDMKKGKMMGHMMMRSVVATTDGGVVVLSGHKMTKYDSDLNVVKEVELKMDKPPMKGNRKPEDAGRMDETPSADVTASVDMPPAHEEPAGEPEEAPTE
jgi:hypothetical protein